MSPSIDALRTDLTNAAALPYGLARSAAIEALVNPADDSGDAALARDVRLELISAYAHGGEPLKRFMPFSWLLDRYDNDPGSFDESSRMMLLWMFKWVSVGALSHPAVSLENIRRGLSDMEDRYHAAGEGLAPYYGCQVSVESHVNGHARAEDAYLAWTRAPRTRLSDCEQCEPTDRVLHLAATSRHAEAVGEALSVLHANTWCLEQPQSIVATSLESMLAVGQATRAAQEHVRGVRLIRGRPGNTSKWASHILVLARAGRLSRGLDLLEDHLHEVDEAPTPIDAMRLAAAGARLLRGLVDEGRGDLTVTMRAGKGRSESAGDGRSEPASVDDVQQRLTQVARDIAAQFDVRNGTGTVGSVVEEWLDASELPDLPLDEVASRRGLGAAPATRARRTAGTTGTTAPTGTPSGSPAVAMAFTVPPTDDDEARQRLAEIDAALDLSQRTGSLEQRIAVMSGWRTLRASLPEHLDATERVAAARLDVALALDDLSEGGGDQKALEAATSRLRAIGHHALAVRYDLFGLARRAGPADEFAALVFELDALLAEADEHCTPADRGCMALPAMSILSSHSAESGVQERITATLQAGIDLLQQGDVDSLTGYQRGCLVGLLLSRVRREQSDDAIPVFRSALALLPPGWRARERAIVGMNLAGELAEVGDLPGARILLEEAAQDARTAGEPEIGADALGMLGRVHNHRGNAPAAVAAFSAAGQLIQETGGPTRIAEGQQELVHALRAAGRSPEAAELAETALQMLVEQTRLDEVDAGSSGASPAAVRVAATLAFAGALAAWDLDEDAHAYGLARRSAAWHRSIGWTLAEAEALTLAGEIGSDPAESMKLFAAAAKLFDGDGDGDGGGGGGGGDGGKGEGPGGDGRRDWRRAARCRRLLAGSVMSAEGLEPAREALAAAQTALEAYTPRDGEEIAYTVEKLALTVQTARILANGDSLGEALAVVEGVDQGYRDVGDQGMARDVIGFQVDILVHLDRAEEALLRQTEIAEEALNAGETHEARGRGADLARILDDLGRSDQAEAAWQRFST